MSLNFQPDTYYSWQNSYSLIPLHTAWDVIDYEYVLCVFIFQVYTTLINSRYLVTDISVKPLFHNDEDLVTVAIIATVDREPTVNLLKSLLIRKLNNSKSLDVVHTVDDIEVTGYSPSCMLLYYVNAYFILLLLLQCIVIVLVELNQTQSMSYVWVQMYHHVLW